jgi:hypothetical protein
MTMIQVGRIIAWAGSARWGPPCPRRTRPGSEPHRDHRSGRDELRPRLWEALSGLELHSWTISELHDQGAFQDTDISLDGVSHPLRRRSRRYRHDVRRNLRIWSVEIGNRLPDIGERFLLGVRHRGLHPVLLCHEISQMTCRNSFIAEHHRSRERAASRR